MPELKRTVKRERIDIRMKPCPFCNYPGELYRVTYPNGDIGYDYGWHYSDCPLDNASFFMQEEDGWTAEDAAKAWNWRSEEP